MQDLHDSLAKPLTTEEKAKEGALDPKNVLNITWIESPSHPCLVKLNGVRCNSNATNVVHIRLENLNLSGTIDADSLCRLQKLTHLNVTGNQSSGRLPNALTKLKHLRNLDISNNNFSGMIPSKQQYSHLLSYYVTPSNKLESNSTKEWLKESPLSDSTPNNGKDPWPEILGVILLGAGLLLSTIYFIVKKSAKFSAEREVVKDHRRVSPITKATTHEVQEVKLKEGDSELVFFVEDRERFTLEDLLRATADLRSEGFCSSLYKIEEFVETLKKISNLKHQNILPLVGYRSTSEEKLIIYEYQSNGSLLNLLNDYIAGRKDFPWKMRLNIACGIARGLAFIYRKLDGEEVMSHGNLKPSNILLDENNEPLIRKSIEVSRIELARWVRSMVREEWTGEVFDKEVRENDHQWAFPLLNIALLCVSRFQENRPTTMEILEKIEEVMDQHHERCASKCCSIGSNHDECCSLHKIIPETWDSPGSNY
uniref:Protein kinase domain-containing protein n=1 Tax=Glycine max TaxID=3847 RepID=A0A0R0GHM5_SOYBN